MDSKQMTSLDLHGYTVHNAWNIFNTHLSNCFYNGIKSTIIVTGHGQISNEIIALTHNSEYATGCSRLDPNTGAYTVQIKKSKHTKKKDRRPDTSLSIKELYVRYNRN